LRSRSAFRHSSVAPSLYEEAVTPESAKDSGRYHLVGKRGSGRRSRSDAALVKCLAKVVLPFALFARRISFFKGGLSTGEGAITA
jgi:hypothetical protein